MAKKKSKPKAYSLPGPFHWDHNKPDWTTELAQFMCRVGVGHARRSEIWRPDLGPFKFDHGEWEQIGEAEALALLADKSAWIGAEATLQGSSPLVGLEDMELRPCKWEFTMHDGSAQGRRASVELRFTTLGGAGLLPAFEEFDRTGTIPEPAMLMRRLKAQEDVDSDLCEAAQDADVAGVREALARGADPDTDIGSIGLAAWIATRHGEEFLPILRALVEGGAAIDGIEIGNWSSQPLLWAAAREENPAAVKLLLELGSDPNVSYHGRKPDEWDGNGGYDPVNARLIKTMIRQARADREAVEIIKVLPKQKPKKVRDTRSSWERPGGPIRDSAQDSTKEMLESRRVREFASGK